MARPTGSQRLEARRARLERHAAETDPSTVLAAAARFLETRPRSIAEVRRHLTAAAYPAGLVEGAIGRLTELGMLDDRAFAQAWVESRDRARPRGASTLRRELALKGIDREIVTAVLVERGDAIATNDATAGSGGASAEEIAAKRLLSKARATLSRVADPRARRQRAYALLARNGFDPDVCRAESARFTSQETGPAD
jgi:regulatory protein